MAALLAWVAFVSGAMAQGKSKPVPAEPAGTPASAPAPAALEKTKLETLSGMIEKVDELGKAIDVKDKVKKVEKTLVFAVGDKTKITKGKDTLSFSDLKKGMNVSVGYKKEGDTNIALAIKVIVPKKTEEKTAEGTKG